MMDFGSGDIATSFKAKLTERVLLDVQVADRYPLTTVKLAVSRTVGLVVLARSDGLMVRTITLGCKVRAARIRNNFV